MWYQNSNVWSAVGAVVGVGSLCAGLYFGAISPLSEKIDAFDDPNTGYPKHVRDATAAAVRQAFDGDIRIKAEVNAEFNKQLLTAMQDTNRNIGDMRKELVHVINNQTERLSQDINSLEKQIRQVESMQNAMMGRVAKIQSPSLQAMLGGPDQAFGVWVVDSKSWSDFRSRIQGYSGLKEPTVFSLSPKAGDN